jgi:Zn-dependent protease with chaperone function
MSGFLILCVATVGLAAAVVSGLVAALLVATEDRLDRLAPAAQSRLLLAAALAPALVVATAITGWIADIYVFGCTLHHCMDQHWTPLPGMAGALLGGAVLTRNGLAVGRAASRAWRSHRTCRRLDGLVDRDPAGLNVLPFDEPQAFVAGLVRPRVYVSRGLLALAPECDLRSILAHERAHAARRDPLRRFIAALALAYHLPGIARRLERHLARAHEMAADAEAARAVGDAQRVAELLVRFVRLRLARPASPVAASWIGSDLEVRVRTLLTSAARPDRPRATTLVVCALFGLLVALGAADPIHRGGELLLGLLDP